jgi:hypothetical protein
MIMADQEFRTLKTGDKFLVNGQEYTKIPDEKVSCCKTLNAIKNSDNTKIMFKPLDIVTLAQ